MPPICIFIPESKVTIFCDDEVPEVETPRVSDPCGSVFLDFREENLPTDNGFRITRTWVATDLCGNTSSYEQVINYIDKEISCSFALATNLLICGTSNNQLTVTNSGGRGPYTYAWRMVDCDGFITDGADEQTITFTSGFTSQNFEVTITDADGCQQTCTHAVDCMKQISAQELIGESSSTKMGSPNDFIIYPNPASTNISVVIPDSKTKTVGFEIIDLLGKKVRSIKVQEDFGKSFEVDVSELPEGTYFIYLKALNGAVTARQFAVIR